MSTTNDPMFSNNGEENPMSETNESSMMGQNGNKMGGSRRRPRRSNKSRKSKRSRKARKSRRR